MAWNIGNTTVRNPNRIQEGLRLFSAEFSGNVDGETREIAFWNRLIDEAVVDPNARRDADINGRKWRSCFTKLGFITGKTYRKSANRRVTLAELAAQNLGLTATPYEVTPIGRRLIDAATAGAVEDIFLRQLLHLEIPSPLEKEQQGRLKPLTLVLQALRLLEQQPDTPHGLNIMEIAAFIQTVLDHNTLPDIIQRLITYRAERATLEGRNAKRRFDRDTVIRATAGTRQQPDTFIDYADTTFRYCRMTGLFSVRGSRLVIQEEKRELVDEILTSEPDFLADSDPLAYLVEFYQGATIPTDTQPVALQQIAIYEREIRAFGEQPIITSTALRDADVQTLTDNRYQIEEQYRDLRERQFSASHHTDREVITDVLRYLDALKRGRISPTHGLRIDDAPSYLEWAIWRAFLTFNHLTTDPKQTRRFPIDMDLLPINHAPGGGADMVMRYTDFSLVVEVTLLGGSRQEAAEGESVRRHVAEFAAQTDQTVYGVFVAPQIDLNTIDTFQRGGYYLNNEWIEISIVPFTINQIVSIIQTVADSLSFSRKTPADLRVLLDSCLNNRDSTNPITWWNDINTQVNRWIQTES